MSTTLRLIAAVALFALHTMAHAGFGGMDEVGGDGMGGASFTGFLGAIAFFGIGGYAAVKYAAKHGDAALGALVVGAVLLLLLFSLLSNMLD